MSAGRVVFSPLPISIPRDRVLEAIRRRDPFLLGSLVAHEARWRPRSRVIRVTLDFNVDEYLERAERGS